MQRKTTITFCSQSRLDRPFRYFKASAGFRDPGRLVSGRMPKKPDLFGHMLD